MNGLGTALLGTSCQGVEPCGGLPYASFMSEKNKSEDQERISRLEQEVEQLRAKLERGAEGKEPDAGALEANRRATLEAEAEDVAEADKLVPSRSRLIIVGVVAGLLCLAAVTAVTLALSQGFSLFANKAASTLYPDDEPGTSSTGASKKPDKKTDKKTEREAEFHITPPGL